jgi:hypothetical protein
MFIKIDDQIVNIKNITVISQEDSDYEDFTKIYTLDENEYHLPKKFKEVVEFLTTKGLDLLQVNDQEAVVKNNLESSSLEYETLTVNFIGGSSHDLETSKTEEELFGQVEKFLVENDEDEDEDELEEEIDFEAELEEAEGISEDEYDQEIINLEEAIRKTEALPEEYFGKETASKKDLPKVSDVKASIKQYSTEARKPETNLSKMAITALVVTAGIVVVLYLLGIAQ